MQKQQFSESTLQSLYVLNKQSKKYRDKASTCYRRGKKAAARKNSCRKSALYAVKDRVLKQIHKSATKVSLHEINGDDFYCLYFEDVEGQEWSFHTPKSNIDIHEDRIEEQRDLGDFTADSDKEATNRSLKASLLHIEDRFGLNANNYLKDKYVDYGRNSYFIGWKYLGK